MVKEDMAVVEVTEEDTEGCGDPRPEKPKEKSFKKILTIYDLKQI